MRTPAGHTPVIDLLPKPRRLVPLSILGDGLCLHQQLDNAKKHPQETAGCTREYELHNPGMVAGECWGWLD